MKRRAKAQWLSLIEGHRDASALELYCESASSYKRGVGLTPTRT